MKNILVTGGAGFIGANFIRYFLATYPDYKLINLDKLTYAADLSNLSDFANHSNYHFIKGDICSPELVSYLFEHFDIQQVVHFAAESHVDNSISGPGEFIRTNINGTFNLVECARKYWMTVPHQFKKGYGNTRFLHVSTDEVYGTLGETGLFTEETPYAPNSPYSASKAASDMIVRSYHHTYGMNTVMTNCSNNYGQFQHDEKLIPTIIRKALSLQPIPIYGKGTNVRDWLYVEDHCRGIDTVLQEGRIGESYNIGGNTERQNIQIVHQICAILDDVSPRKDAKPYSELISFVADRPGHDLRYAIDATKIKNELGWEPQESFETGIRKTIDFYIKKYTK